MAVALPSEVKIKEEGSSGVALFISKVWSFVNDRGMDHLVTWSENGKTFIVVDESRFAKEVLPHYFKHNNFASFVRQLNLYGFRKVAKPDQGALVKAKNDSVEFWHANFRRGHPDLLHLVQRRSVSSRVGTEEKNPFLSQVITDIHHMKGRQENIASLFEELKRENHYLKQEINILKQKHNQQHKILNKIIHFIVHIIYKGRLPTRRSQLMLTDREDDLMSPRSKRPRTSLLSSDPAPTTALYSVQSPPLSSTLPSPLSSPLASTVTFPNQVDDASLADTVALSGDEFLADLFKSTSTTQTPTISTTPVQSFSSVQSEESSPTASLPALVPYTDPSDDSISLNQLTSQLDHQEQGISSLHEVIPGQLSIDPTVLSEFLNNSDYTGVLPDYDVIDTARLLESISSDPKSDVPNEDMVQNALVPISNIPLLDLLYPQNNTQPDQ